MIELEKLSFVIKQTANKDLLYIVKYKGIKVGMASLIEFHNTVEIANLMIKKKAYRGLGISRYIIEKLKQDYKILEINKPLMITAGPYSKEPVLDIKALKNLYKSCGFKKISTLDNGFIEMKLKKSAFNDIEV